MPSAEHFVAANKCQPFFVAQLRCPHLEAHRPTVFRLLHRGVGMPIHTFGHGRAVEISIFGDVDPMVVNMVSDTRGTSQFQPMRLESPLTSNDFVATHHAIEIIDGTTYFQNTFHFARPVVTIYCRHLIGRDLTFAGICRHMVQHQFLAKGGLVLDMKKKVHCNKG